MTDPKPTRRQVLKRTAALAVAGVAGGLGLSAAAQAQSKIAKEQAQYQSSPKDGNQCSGCRFFTGGNACEKVEGEISPNGWCSLYSPKG